ncbi:MAG: hypothetical protein GY749_37740 [Desulfobacteraceae bacterium]|nr:hypothetical protein [Desulfobacteraceae bacterium]
MQAGDIIAWWYPDNTVPSVMYNNTYGQTMNNHDWPSEPMGDVQQDIPDLLANSYWNNTLWGINTRTYSIEVLGESSSGI